MPPSVVCPPRRSRNSSTSVFAPCRAAAMPAGAPPVPPPATTTSYVASTGSSGKGRAPARPPLRFATSAALRPTSYADMPDSAQGPTANIPSGKDVNVSGIVHAIRSAASAWSGAHVRSRAICSATRNDRAEPSANGNVSSCTCIFPVRSIVVNVQGLSPDGNARRAPPARSARRPRIVASISTFARMDWNPLRDATTMPANCPSASRRMSVAGKPVRNGTSAASRHLSSPRLMRNGATAPRSSVPTGAKTCRTPGSWRG